jgi:Tfp pilus assembly protein PilV
MSGLCFQPSTFNFQPRRGSGAASPALSKRSASNGARLGNAQTSGFRFQVSGFSAAFTIVETMMAAVILVVGFMGMIQAVTMGSEMLSTGRRQAVASQVITHEMERMRLLSWSNISSLSTTTTWSSGSAYAVGDTAYYQGGLFACIRAHTNHTPTESAYWAAATNTYSATQTYSLTDVVYYATNGNWYRYINGTAAAGNAPTNTTYWTAYTGPLITSSAAGCVTFSVARIVSDLTTDLREVTFVVSWTKSGTTTAANTTTGTWLQKLSFYRESPIARTYSRSSTSWFTKYGLNYAAQR